MKEKAFVLSEPLPKDDYREFTKKKFWMAMLLLLILLGISLYSLRVGSLHLSISRLFSALFSQNATGLDHHVLWNIRLPRTIGAVIAGAGLGLAGGVMQNILRNPLASPFTIGVSQGAAFGAAFVIIVLGVGKVLTVCNEAVTANLSSLNLKKKINNVTDVKSALKHYIKKIPKEYVSSRPEQILPVKILIEEE